MSDSKKGSASLAIKLLVVGLAVIIVASNVAWFFIYNNLNASYNKEKATANGLVSNLNSVMKLLNTTVGLLKIYKNLTGAYQNLTSVLSLTITTLKDQEAALVYNVSVEAVESGIELIYMANNLTLEANATADPQAKVLYATEAAEAANQSAAMVKLLVSIGQTLSMNQTFMQYAQAAEAAAYNVTSLALSLRSSSNPSLSSQLTAYDKSYYVNILKAEAMLLAEAKALLQSRSTS